MNCHEFEMRFEALLDERLDASVRATCLEHAAACPSCGDLLAAVSESFESLRESPGSSLIDSVLDRTIGSACAQARERLPALVDQELDTADHELVELHLAGCPDCQQLAAILVGLRRELPRLAEVPVDEAFTRQVLAATLPFSTRLRRRWQPHWSNWIRRPRFAMEAAYVGLILVMPILAAFSTPLAALPAKGLELVQVEAGDTSIWTRANQGLGTFWEGFASLLESEEDKQESTEDTP